MALFQAPGAIFENDQGSSAPLVVLFERDDSIAVPLLSQLRMAGYDVRAARTPVDLFDTLSKHLVALTLVDLGNATAGRREFWVALDAQRRGRAMQVMTFRYTPAEMMLGLDFEPTGRAIADVEIHSAHEFQVIIEGVRSRIPLNGAMPTAAPSFQGAPGGYGMAGAMNANIAGAPQYPGGIAPIGAALGVPSPFMYQQQQQSPFEAAQQFGQPAGYPAYGGQQAQYPPTPSYDPAYGAPYPQQPAYPGGQAQAFPGPAFQGAAFQDAAFHEPYQQQSTADLRYQHGGQQGAFAPPSPFAVSGQVNPFAQPTPPQYEAPSPFAHPANANPFAQQDASPFAQPYTMNPFAESPMSGGHGGNGGPAFEVSAQMTQAAPALNPWNTPAQHAEHFAGFNPGFNAGFDAGRPQSAEPTYAFPYAAPPAAAERNDAERFPTAFAPAPPESMANGVERNPWSAPGGDHAFEERAARLSEAYAAQFGIATGDAQPFGSQPFGLGAQAFGSQPGSAFGAGVMGAPAQAAPNWGASEPRHQRAGEPVQDAWTPPADDELEGETGVVPQMAFDTPVAPSAAHSVWGEAPRDDEWPQLGERLSERGYAGVAVAQPPQAASASAQSRLPAVQQARPTDHALGSVLVEGALVTENKMEALRGIQQLLESVDLRFRLGELALLFKFLSPDQLLAALLVSRGLVSPQQIAGLGRVKQELAASGMDYNLETLLVMFHILPADQLRELRAELGQAQRQ